MAELWTAVSEDGDRIVFDVLDEATGQRRQETCLRWEVAITFARGWYPESIIRHVIGYPFPWRFRKDGDDIHLDGPSVGLSGYELTGTDDQEVNDVA